MQTNCGVITLGIVDQTFYTYMFLIIPSLNNYCMIETLLNFKCFSYQFNALSFKNKKVQVEVVLRHWKKFIISDKLLRGTDN